MELPSNIGLEEIGQLLYDQHLEQWNKTPIVTDHGMQTELQSALISVTTETVPIIMMDRDTEIDVISIAERESQTDSWQQLWAQVIVNKKYVKKID